MSVSFVYVMLLTFSAMLLAVGVAQLAFEVSAVGGWASIAIGMSLIAIAAATRKKSTNG